jgi:glutaconate CoA-transferase subunit A
MRDKRMSIDDVVAQLKDGMTIGIGGWGSRRKPMALVRGILRSDLKDLTIVSYGGPDVGLLCQAGKVRQVVYAFVSLDSIPLEPLFGRARQNATCDVREWDEGMFQTGLRAAAQRLPALPLDVALVHLNRADAHGNASYLGPDPYFDDLFCLAADRAFVSVEQVTDTAGLTVDTPVQRLLLNRMMVTGVVEAPNGAHFTSCTPDYDRDEAFQKAYAAAAKDEAGAWAEFEQRFLAGDEQTYQDAVAAFHEEAAR